MAIRTIITRAKRGVRNYATNPDTERRNPEKSDPSGGPLTLLEWTEFHERIQRLPDEQREVFDLWYYQGLTNAEAAEVMGMSERTYKRRLLQAKLAISAAMRGSPPGED